MTHHHDPPSDNLSFEEKLTKILAHWIHHNGDHAETYRRWARQAEENQLAAIAPLLDESAELTQQISKRFESAIKLLS